MNGEKQKFIGGIDFEELRAQRVQLYNAIIIDLATARINEEMVFTGNYIYALEATDVDANLDIRFNELFRAVINIKKGRGVRIPFYRFYLTNTAQAGKTLTLAIGIEASDFEVFDVGKALGITGTVDVNLASSVPLVNVKQTMPAGAVEVTESNIYAGAVGTLYTVSAGKTLYLFETISIISASAGGDFTALVANAADVEQYKLHYGRLLGATNHDLVSDFTYPKIIPEGWKIRATTSVGTCNLTLTIHGYEV